MSFAHGNDTRDQVRQATDIVDLVGSYIELRRQGRIFVGRCPWHDDSKPSLQVNPERQSWKCWVCDIGGDIFSFVMKREGVEFREALQLLADKAGIEVVKPKAAPVEPGSPDDKRTLYQAMAWAEKQFHECLLESSEAEAARRYFDERGITEESIARFHLGYSPDDWQWIIDRARRTPYSPAVLEAVGLILKSQNTGRYYDRFKGRVMFPIRDLQSRPIAFGGRVLPGSTDAAKYVNTSETRLFTKSDNLYALDLVRDHVAKSTQRTTQKSKRIVVVEGYTDVVICHQCGLRDVVAVLGTALNQRHIQLLRRFVDSVMLVLDGDEAGQTRTNDILDLFVAEQMDLRIMTLPDELDPAEFLLERSADEFRQLLDGAVDALEHKIRVTTRGLDVARETHRANQALESILQTISKAPRPQSMADAAAKLREQQVLTRISRQFFIPETAIRERLNELRAAQKPRVGETGDAGSDASGSLGKEATTPGAALRAMPAAEVELLEIFSLHPELVGPTLDRIGVAHLSSPSAQTLFEAYRVVYENGDEPSFENILSALEDARLKSLLVQLDDQAHAKNELAAQPAPERLRELIRRFCSHEEELERQELTASLTARPIGSNEELELLKHLHDLELLRRGITAPTDGTRPRT